MNWENRWRKKISKHKAFTTGVYYLFGGLEKETKPTKREIGHWAHVINNYVIYTIIWKKWFSDEEYELITKYKNSKQKLTYKYHGRLYKTTFNEWLWHYNPTHLRKNGNNCLVLRIFTFSFFCFCFDFFIKQSNHCFYEFV